MVVHAVDSHDVNRREADIASNVPDDENRHLARSRPEAVTSAGWSGSAELDATVGPANWFSHLWLDPHSNTA